MFQTALDKCQSPELNDCHEKANCTNTPDSYSCTCLDGYAGDGVHCEGMLVVEMVSTHFMLLFTSYILNNY